MLGPCWFYCGHQVTAVLWIGCATTVGAGAPLYICGPCLDQLHAMLWDFTELNRAAPTDAEGRHVPLYRPSAVGPPTVPRRRAPARPARTRLGERLLRLASTGARGEKGEQ
ncbi:hypothetical protein FH609_006685 [Streptomyces sp. 3MP-14]|uniref:Uncharacterized protein n=1 Tax=Streptomyces mimosae TaxID=2586635 RepID=A0A5N6AMN1_9ACTN|nr:MULTISPECIES: hypothetical protein [Streptomyces]KAB8169941.1 hypothetical protein FH607_004365 [Streptomyces mimosae]KAB8178689.1 hypothetical protein FH609_006685 [Streptomyces sp. 3MP-14]